MFEILVAVILLTAPVDEPIVPIATIYRPYIQKLALSLQILDPRECQYVMNRESDFDTDLKLLRKRYDEFKNAPLEQDAWLFPDRNLMTELLGFNRTYRLYLDQQRDFNDWQMWEYTTAIQECDELYGIWDFARDAKCEYYYITVRRAALQKLQEKIGYQNFRNGLLPPVVPIWRFNKMD